MANTNGGQILVRMLQDRGIDTIFFEQLRNGHGVALLCGHEDDLEVYLEDYGEWEAGRNTAVGKSEGEIDFFHKNYYWTYVNKDDPAVYWGKTVLGWGMMFLLSNGFIGIVMILMRRKI